MTNHSLTKIAVANNLFSKTLGVMGWKNFGNKEGLLLTQTNSIHTYFVRFPIDLVFLNKDFQIVKLIKNLGPFRISPIVWQANHVLEMPAGSIAQHQFEVGDSLKFKNDFQELL